MGCQCTKNNLSNDKEEISPSKEENIQEDRKENINYLIKSKEHINQDVINKDFVKLDQSEDITLSLFSKNINNLSYVERVLELVNAIRQNPCLYAQEIENSIKYIIEEREPVTDPVTNERKEKLKIVFKKKVKVALTRGEPAFHEAIEYLKILDPVNPLEFKKEIIIPPPEAATDIKDSTYIKQKVLEIQEHDPIDIFFKDLIKDPDVSTLLMIVDDNGKNSGKKRSALLNPYYKYIGISCKFIGKTFVAFFSFSE